MAYGDVTIGAAGTFQVVSFAWPSTVRRVGIHVTAEGRLYEVDSATRLTDVDLELVGSDVTGWADMTEAAKNAIEDQYRAGVAVTITDWRGNTGTFLYVEAPRFEPVAADGEGSPTNSFYKFTLRLARVT